jgi:TatA/E family protein of Tat protein translocase
MFANFGPGHWAVLAIVMSVLFGAKKLPDAARSLGRKKWSTTKPSPRGRRLAS